MDEHILVYVRSKGYFIMRVLYIEL